MGARMAEWSKAPDLRSSVDKAIAMVEELGYSGLLVRISRFESHSWHVLTSFTSENSNPLKF